MRILSISGILPIPGVVSHNDFVFQTHRAYREIFPEDSITIIRTTQYKTNIKKVIQGETELKKLKRRYRWEIDNWRVEIFTFLSSRKLRDLHAILSYTSWFFNRARLIELFKAQKFDIIHAQYIYPDGLLAYKISKKYNIPYVITSHNELYYFRFPISRRIGLKILRNAFKILPINYRNFTYFKKLDLPNVEILPLGFNKSFIKEQKSTKNSLPIKVLTVCELIPLKNVDKVIMAIKPLINTYDITYTVIGRGPEKHSLLTLVNNYGIQDKVKFIEHIPYEKIADEMYKHDIFIMTSYIETFGRVYFEAMAMGIPVICAKNSGIFGYFKEKEEGISVNHMNINEISNALELLISNQDLRFKIGKQGQKLVMNYTWNNIVKKLNSIYTAATIRQQ